MYYLGIDGGGGFSRLIAAQGDMKVIGRHAGMSLGMDAANSPSVPENARKLISEFFKLTATAPANCAAVCVGANGVNTDKQARELVRVFEGLGFTCPVKAVSSEELILAAGTKGQPGVAVIAGVEASGFALSANGTKNRVSGWGGVVDDAGSAYWIGIRAIRAALRAHDGRGDRTALADKIKEHCKLSEISDIISYINSEKLHRAKISELALLVKYAAAAGDEPAAQIEKEAAAELFLIADALLGRGGFGQTTVVKSGSVFTLNERVSAEFDALLRKKHDGASIVTSAEKPELGAVYLAKRILE